MQIGRTTERNPGPYTGAYTAVGDAPRTAVGAAYGAVKQALLLGEYPLGVRLVEERLGRDIGVSRTPVREALLRLHTEGLVCRHTSGGYAPTVPNIAETRELYEVRVALEHAALLRPRTSGRAHDRPLLLEIREEWAALAGSSTDPSPEFVVFDESFHVRLAEAAGNRELAELLRRVNERIRVVRMRDFLTTDRIARTVDEHLDLVDLVIAGDLDAAVAAYDTHVRTSLDVVEQRVAGALLQMAAHR